MKQVGQLFKVTSLIAILALPSCSSMKSVLALQDQSLESKPIENPFGDFYAEEQEKKKNIVLRTKRGDRAVEVELPSSRNKMSHLVVPLSPDFKQNMKSQKSSYDHSYQGEKPGTTDREIVSDFKEIDLTGETERRGIEGQLGLMPAVDDTPKTDRSYLAQIDYVKQLFRDHRYEAGVIEIDKLIRQYPTNPRLYEMKGTLLDRLGYADLAHKAWKESIELNPNNQILKKFLDKRAKVRNREVASPR